MFCRFFIYEKSERVFGKRTVSLRKKFQSEKYDCEFGDFS